MPKPRLLTLTLIAMTTGLTQPLHASDMTFVDPCIDAINTENGADAPKGGTVLSQQFSEAGTLVMLEDATGTVWRCVSYKDGTVGELTKSSADQVPPTPDSYGEVVRFAAGESSAEYKGTLGPGEAYQYTLGARDQQFLDVNISAPDGSLDYQIINPDDTRLLDMVAANKPYRGQLYLTGDHVVELVNRTSDNLDYSVRFEIE